MISYAMCLEKTPSSEKYKQDFYMKLHLNADDQTIFNYKLSRASTMNDNTFGILASRYITYLIFQAHCMIFYNI